MYIQNKKHKADPDIQARDWLVSVDLKVAYFHFQKALSYHLISLKSLDMTLVLRAMQACLSQEHVKSLLSTLTSFKLRRSVPLKCFQRLLGLMVADAVVCQF